MVTYKYKGDYYITYNRSPHDPDAIRELRKFGDLEGSVSSPVQSNQVDTSTFIGTRYGKKYVIYMYSYQDPRMYPVYQSLQGFDLILLLTKGDSHLITLYIRYLEFVIGLFYNYWQPEKKQQTQRTESDLDLININNKLNTFNYNFTEYEIQLIIYFIDTIFYFWSTPEDYLSMSIDEKNLLALKQTLLSVIDIDIKESSVKVNAGMSKDKDRKSYDISSKSKEEDYGNNLLLGKDPQSREMQNYYNQRAKKDLSKSTKNKYRSYVK